MDVANGASAAQRDDVYGMSDYRTAMPMASDDIVPGLKLQIVDRFVLFPAAGCWLTGVPGCCPAVS